MVNIIIATLYKKEPVMVSATRFGADSLFLIVDEKPAKEQQNSLETIKEALGEAIKVNIIKTKLYDIVDTAKKCVSIIDDHSEKDNIIVDITASRKTQSLGLLFAAYKRSDMVNKIVYISEEDRATVELPKLSFKIRDNQELILKIIKKRGYSNLKDLADKAEISRGMLHRNLVELRNMGLIEKRINGFELTDAGRIAIL